MKQRFLSSLLFVSLGIVNAQAQIASFQHVVVIVQENRSTDNLFQGLCVHPQDCSTNPSPTQYNIQTQNWLDKTSQRGVTQPGLVALASVYDLDHSHGAYEQMCDSAQPPAGRCKMDGAATVKCIGNCPSQPQFRYVDNSTGILNPYLQLAIQYGWANYFFQTNQGPSFPAHQFLFGGTSAPGRSDDAAGIFAAENTGKTNAAAGCTAPAGTLVRLIKPPGVENPNDTIYPCFEHQTLADLLAPSHSWRYYAPTATSIWTAPNAISHICQSNGPGGQCLGQEWVDNVSLKPAAVLTDISNCTLRDMSWVVPTAANSDHAHINDGGGPSWVAAVVNAIGNSSNCDANNGYWKNTAIFITWDDWGGWYDHEVPIPVAQPEGDYQLGFRVPLVVVSAYTPAAFISNSRHDFGSVLRFIEQNFGITEGALNFADARANTNLTAFFNLGALPRKFQQIPAPKDAAFFLNDKRPAGDPDDQ